MMAKRIANALLLLFPCILSGVAAQPTAPVFAPTTPTPPTPPTATAPSRKIEGKVLLDTNGNGRGNSPIKNVPITVRDSRNRVIQEGKTNAQGIFSFSVPPGTYKVVQKNLAGFVDVKDSDAGNANSIAVDVRRGSKTNLFFIDRKRTYVIAGIVQQDTNGNGKGDRPIQGSFVAVFKGKKRVARKKTAKNGRFRFTLPPGIYSVRQINKAGFVDVTDTDKGKNLSVIRADIRRRSKTNLVFVDKIKPAGPSPPTQPKPKPRQPGTRTITDLGGIKAPTELNKIVGQVLEDVDNDGLGEDPIKKVAIQLYDHVGSLVAITRTDASGTFWFKGLPANTFTVIEITPKGFSDVADTDGGNPNVVNIDVPKDKPTAYSVIFVDEVPSAAPSVAP